MSTPMPIARPACNSLKAGIRGSSPRSALPSNPDQASAMRSAPRHASRSTPHYAFDGDTSVDDDSLPAACLPEPETPRKLKARRLNDAQRFAKWAARYEYRQSRALTLLARVLEDRGLKDSTERQDALDAAEKRSAAWLTAWEDQEVRTQAST